MLRIADAFVLFVYKNAAAAAAAAMTATAKQIGKQGQVAAEAASTKSHRIGCNILIT